MHNLISTTKLTTRATLTRWLPSRNILVIIWRIYRYQFKWNYCIFAFIAFSESKLDWKEKMKKMKKAWNYWLRKTWLLKCMEVTVSNNPLAVNMLKTVMSFFCISYLRSLHVKMRFMWFQDSYWKWNIVQGNKINFFFSLYLYCTLTKKLKLEFGQYAFRFFEQASARFELGE